jgi:hypothetical protein
VDGLDDQTDGLHHADNIEGYSVHHVRKALVKPFVEREWQDRVAWSRPNDTDSPTGPEHARGIGQHRQYRLAEQFEREAEEHSVEVPPRHRASRRK